jgi:hypothetical protein
MSDEPTDTTPQPTLAEHLDHVLEWCSFHENAWSGEPPERLACSYEKAPLTYENLFAVANGLRQYVNDYTRLQAQSDAQARIIAKSEATIAMLLRPPGGAEKVTMMERLEQLHAEGRLW